MGNGLKTKEDLVTAISEWFVRQGQTLSLAESCTGGLLSSAVTARPGASAYYLGSVISYSPQIKHDLLGVSWSLMKTMGEVSRPVAKAMAVGARRTLGSDWAISVTGIAGPSGGTPDKPVGTVCFGICGPGIEMSTETRFESPSGVQADRVKIQTETVRYALEYIWNGLHS